MSKKWTWQDVIAFLQRKGWATKSGAFIMIVGKAGMMFDTARIDFWTKVYEFGSWLAMGGVMKAAVQSDTGRRTIRQSIDKMAKLRGSKTPNNQPPE